MHRRYSLAMRVDEDPCTREGKGAWRIDILHLALCCSSCRSPHCAERRLSDWLFFPFSCSVTIKAVFCMKTDGERTHTHTHIHSERRGRIATAQTIFLWRPRREQSVTRTLLDAGLFPENVHKVILSQKSEINAARAGVCPSILTRVIYLWRWRRTLLNDGQTYYRADIGKDSKPIAQEKKTVIFLPTKEIR